MVRSDHPDRHIAGVRPIATKRRDPNGHTVSVLQQGHRYGSLGHQTGDPAPTHRSTYGVLIFGVISAALITVSAAAVRALFNIPNQTEAYHTSLAFVGVVIAVGLIVIMVAAFGFNALSDFASICAPWLMVMFTVGGMVLIPALAESVTGSTTLTSFSDFVAIAGESVFTGINAEGEPGIGLIEVIGFAWAANTLIHFGMIDMALLRYVGEQHGSGVVGRLDRC
ncbi:hypothetical protein BH23ACT6_BH23ACT6_00630 [soil metagenome]